MESPDIVDTATWLEHRVALLKKEKEFTQLKDELNRERRKMPWRKVEKPYLFAEGENRLTLSELFSQHSQLVIYHFMFGPEWEEACKSCSFWADNFNGIDIHLAHRDISFLAVSSASYERLDAFRKRMGWNFRWLSSSVSDFNVDFQVSFTEEMKTAGQVHYNYKTQPYFIDELPGVSVFAKDADGDVYHTYSTYSRGVDLVNGAYNYIDLTPKGRNETDGIMNWLRIRDQYD